MLLVEANPLFDEKAVVQAILQGQSYQFNELVVRYQDRLFNGLYAMLGNRHDAEDVAQEAFAMAYRKLASFESKSSFFTWLHRIAFNLAIDHKRREKRHKHPQERSDGDSGVGMELMDNRPGETPIEQIERDESCTRLYAALAQIDPERRAVLTLRDLQGLNYDEISLCLGIPAGTVRSRLHRARLELKEVLLSQGQWSEVQ
jgi:RNA polymerase sigma-70 factor, ECF subfamily